MSIGSIRISSTPSPRGKSNVLREIPVISWKDCITHLFIQARHDAIFRTSKCVKAVFNSL
ncbi:hypothetical protein GALMADRAFT_757706 [Galerina marginata CBS 339.88]|uniref:Uncharacterized protein n=1 Tax=Galerina marginata (strain CBS 339.88) TaxID=685588 RepID=A0A067SRG1_GALM3|nr:hypothetical protein GALMADRAFT_757706 [Galerina marginata CBS 339.88]